MDSNQESFEVEFTDECIEELEDIYNYISTNLKEDKAARRLMSKVMEKILNLKDKPEIYMKIGKTDGLKREYHRMVIKNYILLYTIDIEKKKVYIVHIVYKRRNYFKFL